MSTGKKGKRIVLNGFPTRRGGIGRQLGNVSALFVSTITVNGLNYGHSLLLGSTLGPSESGAYAAFSALFLAVSLLPISLQQAGVVQNKNCRLRSATRPNAIAPRNHGINPIGNLEPVFGLPVSKVTPTSPEGSGRVKSWS